MIEKWCAIPGQEGFYEVSNQGRFRSLPRMLNAPLGNGAPARPMKGQILATHADCTGTRRLSLSRTHTTILCGPCVLEAFGNPPPAPTGWTAGYRDGDPSNLALANLYWTPRVALGRKVKA